MKKSLSLLFAVLCLGACIENELQPEYYSDSGTLYASMESIDATRTSMDEYNNVLWSENDQLIAFMNTTLGIKYQIKEQYVGTTTGGFSKVQDAGSSDDLDSGQEIDHNVVLYPHSDQVWCMKYDNNTPAKSYKLNVVLPETQTYAENSFANGAFPMVAVSTNNQLTFKNICGGVKLQFKGVDKIKSIKLEGLGNEAISGKSSVVAYADGSTPTITMAATASKSVTLDCGEGVQLSESTPTTFIIAVPPVTFSSGMKIAITDTDGLSKTLTNSSSNTIKRSSLLNFPVITYKQNGVLEFPEGALTSYELPAEGGTIEIPVVTNLDYQVVIPDDASDWISVVETKALREEVITLNISGNTTAEARSAEVLVTTTSGIISQSIAINQLGGNPPQPGDYVDEYGINHGQGVKIGEVIWAPVNCGYHATDFKYGKLYQWGRKYGQGYDGDATVPEIEQGRVSLSIGQSEENENRFNYFTSSPYDWCSSPNDKLWNSGTEDNPVKTEYDPCPSGWRVPTYAELNDLRQNHSSLTTGKKGQVGYWFSGVRTYTSDVSQVFLPAAGYRSYYGGNAKYRGNDGYYWSSRPYNSFAYTLYFNSSFATMDSNYYRATGSSIRCVQEASVEPSVPEGPANNEIWYTSKHNGVINPGDTDVFGAEIVSNTYEDGKGVITFDSAVTQIGDYAFYESGNLTSITIPDNVTSIGHGTFCKCSELAEFKGKFAADNGRILLVDGKLVAFAPSGLSEYTIPDGVTSIGYEAFRECDNLTDITISNSVSVIDGHAFQNCDKITEITIPGNVTSIGEYAFDYCKALANVNIGSGVSVIKHLAFYGCQSLKSITIPDNVTEIGSEAFDGCTSLESVTIGKGITAFAGYLFARCTALVDVIIPDWITSIGNCAFYECASLKSVTIPESVTEIGGMAFSECIGLKEVYCKSTTPPNGGKAMFSSYSHYQGFNPVYKPLDCKIFVPAQSVNLYKERVCWDDYASIIFAMPTDYNIVNLSEDGTANSYIVSEAGTYKFTPTKGNSSESVGSIASAVVLWETFGTAVTPNVGDLVKNVKYENGVISFETPSAYKEGNAVIAAKDASGTILWSWHIWLTDQPEGQVYYNNAGTMMDRNLGATSATPGDVGALGLLYQWGRKDPFMGSSSLSESLEAKSTITWPSAVSSNSSNGTIAYATVNPTTFITTDSNNFDWYYTGSSSNENTRWTTSETSKSIYDPCPAGWRVPDGGDNGVWSKAIGSSSSFRDYPYDSTNNGGNFSGKFGSFPTIWYPASGYRNGGGSLINVALIGHYWSASHIPHRAYILFVRNNGYVGPAGNDYRAHGKSVRCVQVTD